MAGLMRSLLMLLACFVGAFPGIAEAKGLSGWTEDQLAKRSAEYAKLDPSAIAKNVVIKGDDLDPSVRFDTEPAYRFRGGFTNEVRADSFLRVFVDRKTGATTWQVYQTLAYAIERRDFAGASYAAADGPVSTGLVIADKKLELISGLKLYRDTLAFELPETLAREIAARASVSPGTPWRFRFRSRVGLDWTDDMPPAEFAGMLQAVERWRSEHSQP